jgi:ubiquinone/menaquinone biosynthesis C-methylase UbiE
MDRYKKSFLLYNRLRENEQLEKTQFIKWLIKPKPADKILDVGCGTGISMSVFAKNNRIIGLDKSEAMLKLNPYKKVLGCAENLPFKDKSFDIVISVTCAQNFSSIHKALKEMKRVSKKVVAISILSRSKKLKVLKNAVAKYFKNYEEYKINVDVLFICSK